MASLLRGALMLLVICCRQVTRADDSLCVEDIHDDNDLGIILCVNRPDTKQVDHNVTLTIWTRPAYFDNFTNSSELTLAIHYQHENIVEGPENVTIHADNRTQILLYGVAAGRTVISFTCPNNTDNKTCPFSEDYLKLVEREVSIANSLPLNIFIDIVGWIYFVAWSISFYPQIFLNFKRRSVVGLNFDFLALNITGFLCYAAFNVGLFWITTVQQEYFVRHPAGVNPVLLNDVIFALHAVAATLFTIFQCVIFERGGQRMSYSALLLLIAMWLVIFITLFISVGQVLAWLDYLYVLSYIKLAITLVKYVPQAWFNCKRRSTEGWSIGNVLLDFTGGSFSVFQMFLLSYNYDDWNSIFGDPTKFGLGVFSIFFDVIFIFQHYVCFRKKRKAGYKKIDSDDATSVNEDTPLLKDEIGSTLVQEKKKRRKLLECFT